MNSATSELESTVEETEEQDPVPVARMQETSDQPNGLGPGSQTPAPLSPNKCEGVTAVRENEGHQESLEHTSTTEDDDSQDETLMGDLDQASRDMLDDSQIMFRTIRGSVIEVFHAALKTLLLQLSPPLNADRATLEELRIAYSDRWSMEDNMKNFKETIDDSGSDGDGVDNDERREQRYRDITLVSKDVSFYAKIFRVFFKEYEQKNWYQCLTEMNHLRNELSHYTKDDAKVTIEGVRKSVVEAIQAIRDELECPQSSPFLTDLVNKLRFLDPKLYSDSVEKLFPPKKELIRSARDETKILNNRYNNCNVLTWMQQLQVCESIQGVKLSDVFVSPLMTFGEKPLDDLTEVFGDEADIDACTGLRAVFVSGPSGVGKSTLAHRLVQSWLDRSSPHLQQFEVVFLIDLQRAQHSDIFSHLQDVMPLTMKELSVENFVQCFIDLKVLLVIDGFDKRYPRRGKLLMDIREKFSRSSALIITTNDSFSKAHNCFVSVADFRRPDVRVIGFDLPRCLDFGNKFSAVLNGDDRRTKLSKKFELVMRHRQILVPYQRESPLVVSLSMLILLLDSNMNKELFGSKPKIFHALFSTLQRTLEKTCSVAERASDEYVEDEVFLKLGEMCLQKLQCDGRLEISKEDSVSLGLKDSSFALCLLKNERINQADATSSFWALSLMHHLAALFLSNEVQVKEQKLDSYFKPNSRFKELLPYLVRDVSLLEKYGQEIFDIARQIKKTSSEDVHTFWFDLFSQTELDPNSVLLESLTKEFRDTEWSLNKETLVPAAGLLKFLKPGVTHELKINLTCHDNSTTVVLMQHLRECLRDNYSNGNTTLSLSLDLGLINMATSSLWLEELEEPFLLLVDITAHIDAESALKLRDCRHLSSVTLRLSSLESFNQFTECYETYELLETVKLYICFLDSLSGISEGQVKRLSSKEVSSEPRSFELIFDGLTSNLISEFISFMQNVLPSNQEFFRIALCKTSLDFSDARKLLCTKYFENGRLNVESTCSLSTVQKNDLKEEMFRDEDGLHHWPFFQFSWNGCHW